MVAQFGRQLSGDTVNKTRIRRKAQILPRDSRHILRVRQHTRQHVAFFVLQFFKSVFVEFPTFVFGQIFNTRQNFVPAFGIVMKSFPRRTVALFAVAPAAGKDFVRPRIQIRTRKRQQVFDFKFRRHRQFHAGNRLAAKRTAALRRIFCRIFPKLVFHAVVVIVFDSQPRQFVTDFLVFGFVLGLLFFNALLFVPRQLQITRQFDDNRIRMSVFFHQRIDLLAHLVQRDMNGRIVDFTIIFRIVFFVFVFACPADDSFGQSLPVIRQFVKNFTVFGIDERFIFFGQFVEFLGKHISRRDDRFVVQQSLFQKRIDFVNRFQAQRPRAVGQIRIQHLFDLIVRQAVFQQSRFYIVFAFRV